MQLLICYVSNTSFTFKLDESTSSQVTKYDAFIYNFGQMYDELVNCYCGSLFVGHCTADSFVEHIHESEKSVKLDPSVLLHLGVDGCILNKSFENKLVNKLRDRYPHMLNIGSCGLHEVHNACRDALKVLCHLQLLKKRTKKAQKTKAKYVGIVRNHF